METKDTKAEPELKTQTKAMPDEEGEQASEADKT